MIVSVTSKDGTRLYTKVQANAQTIEETRRQLQAVTETRLTAELLADAYYLNPGCAALQLPCPECRGKVAA